MERLAFGSVRMLAVMAHPDDAEFFAGGFLAQAIASGAEAHLMLLTDGQGGSMDPSHDRPTIASLRRREQLDAAKVLGLASVRFFGAEDGRLFDSWPLRLAIARRIREVRPEVLVTTDPTEFFVGNHLQHPDHRAAGATALAAAMPFANVRHAAPELDDLEPHTISHVVLIASARPNAFAALDDAHLERKVASLRAHASQMGHWDVESFMRDRAVDAGRAVGVELAETMTHVALR